MPALHATKRTIRRLLSVLVFACVLSATANAYTIVMHGGRRVEIPSRFVVTAATLTYEVSPGVQVTLNVAAIDVPATEKVNNEAPGSLLLRAQATSIESPPRAEGSVQSAKRLTITNRDLESAMRRRRESELAYERRRKELGLPSVEESRRRAAAESALIGPELEQTLAVEKKLESYWRARASALRTEIAAVDAQLRYVRSQLDEPSFPAGNGSFTNFATILPFSFGIAGGRSAFSPTAIQPRVFVAPHRGAQLSGHVAFGGSITRGQVFVNPLGFPRTHRFGSPVFAPANVAVFASSAFHYSYERSQLITQFNELAAARAGLSARWRELEDEARRAGAPPGWLRP